MPNWPTVAFERYSRCSLLPSAIKRFAICICSCYATRIQLCIYSIWRIILSDYLTFSQPSLLPLNGGFYWILNFLRKRLGTKQKYNLLIFLFWTNYMCEPHTMMMKIRKKTCDDLLVIVKKKVILDTKPTKNFIFQFFAAKKHYKIFCKLKKSFLIFYFFLNNSNSGNTVKWWWLLAIIITATAVLLNVLHFTAPNVNVLPKSVTKIQ